MTSSKGTAITGTTRKSVSKRARYEVLNRDAFTCQYCGAKAPDVELHVDHVIPVALGGDNKPGNLVAACKDCNAGKGATNPDSPLVQRLSDEAATYALAVANKIASVMQKISDADDYAADFHRVWLEWQLHPADLPHDWRTSTQRWQQQGIPIALLEHCLSIALRKQGLHDRNAFRYMAGVLYRTLEQEDVSFTLGDKKVRLYTEAEHNSHGSQSYQDGAHDWGNYLQARAQYTDPLARHIDKQSQAAIYQRWDFICRDWDVEARARLESAA